MPDIQPKKAPPAAPGIVGESANPAMAPIGMPKMPYTIALAIQIYYHAPLQKMANVHGANVDGLTSYMILPSQGATTFVPTSSAP